MSDNHTGRKVATVAALPVLVAAGLALGAFSINSSSPVVATPTFSPTPTVQADANSTDGCGWGAIDSPSRLTVPARGVDVPVAGLPTDGGNVPAPPEEAKFEAVWWNSSPKPGSDKGHVIMTAHEWYGDVALGNVLSDKLQPGDVIRVSDGQHTVCYRYTKTIELDIATYDIHSTTWVDPDGEPLLTVMICWDYDPGSGTWLKRHVFEAEPVK